MWFSGRSSIKEIMKNKNKVLKSKIKNSIYFFSVAIFLQITVLSAITFLSIITVTCSILGNTTVHIDQFYREL